MTKIIEHERVTCTPQEMEGFLDRFFANLPGTGHDSTLRVRVPLLGDAAIEKDVAASVTDLDAGDDECLLAIKWEPSGGGPYPRFRGILSVRPGQESNACLIALEGEYDPPGGLLGRLFGRSLGPLIARKTMRDLLERLKAGAEAELRSRAG